MEKEKFPTEEELRQSLLLRAGRFAMVTGLPLSVISRKAVNDSSWLSRDVAGGWNFTIDKYTRFQNWLSENWPDGKG